MLFWPSSEWLAAQSGYSIWHHTLAHIELKAYSVFIFQDVKKWILHLSYAWRRHQPVFALNVTHFRQEILEKPQSLVAAYNGSRSPLLHMVFISLVDFSLMVLASAGKEDSGIGGAGGTGGAGGIGGLGILSFLLSFSLWERLDFGSSKCCLSRENRLNRVINVIRENQNLLDSVNCRQVNLAPLGRCRLIVRSTWYKYLSLISIRYFNWRLLRKWVRFRRGKIVLSNTRVVTSWDAIEKRSMSPDCPSSVHEN